jgi:hypothetical protein
MVFKGNMLSLVHSLVQYRTGLGPASSGNGRTFGLVGEYVGAGTAPLIMVPSTSKLAAWVQQPIPLHKPLEDEVDGLKDSANRTIPKPTVQEGTKPRMRTWTIL